MHPIVQYVVTFVLVFCGVMFSAWRANVQSRRDFLRGYRAGWRSGRMNYDDRSLRSNYKRRTAERDFWDEYNARLKADRNEP